MSVHNLGVVFGPTLLRAVEETLAAILDIKFNNVVIEILIENYDQIFKTAPGKPSAEYLTHSSPPETVPRSYNTGYRSSRNSLTAATTQPVVRVVTRSNYTDTVMSSSLQNIPNGMAIYANNVKPSKNHHPIYDTKPHMNQSTPTLNRDINLSAREPTYVTTSSNSNSHNASPNHRSVATAGAAITVPHHQQSAQMNHGSSREKLLHSRDANLTRSSGDGIYVQSQRPNPMNYSENNLVHPGGSVMDRINSTSSSNESVCSTSSLNHSYGRHQPVVPPTANYLEYSNGSSGGTYTTGGSREDSIQNYMPKKTQRTKETVRQRYNSPRDNL